MKPGNKQQPCITVLRALLRLCNQSWLWRSSTSQSPGFRLRTWGSLPCRGGCRIGWGKGYERRLGQAMGAPAWAWFSHTPVSPLLMHLLSLPVRWKPLCSWSPWTCHPSHSQFWAGRCSQVHCGRAMSVLSGPTTDCPRLGGKAGWAGGSEAAMGTGWGLSLGPRGSPSAWVGI